MKRTTAAPLLVSAALGVMAGFLIDHLLTSSGRPTFAPSGLLPIMLVVLAGALVVLALGIRRSTGEERTRPVNPFWAMRIAILAKSSSLLGAIVSGVGVGLLIFLFTRPVQPSLGSTGAIVATIAGGVVLIVAALVAEHLCAIRKDDDDDLTNTAGPTPTPDTPSHH